MIPVGNKKLFYSLSGGITTFNPRLIMEYPLSGIGGAGVCRMECTCAGIGGAGVRRMECPCGGLVARVDASPYGDGLMCSRGLSAAIPTGR